MSTVSCRVACRETDKPQDRKGAGLTGHTCPRAVTAVEGWVLTVWHSIEMRGLIQENRLCKNKNPARSTPWIPNSQEVRQGRATTPGGVCEPLLRCFMGALEHMLAIAQKIVQMMTNHLGDNRDQQGLIVMHGDIAKPDHLLQIDRQGQINPAARMQ